MYRVLVLVLLQLLSQQCQSAGIQFHVIREWRYVNFTWPNDDFYNRAIANQMYTPENNVVAGLKYFEGYYYLTLPRMKTGVPATLTRISASNNVDTSPLLQPYPSWEMNTLNDCNALQNVQNIEIDTKGQIWIIDGGHTSTLLQPPVERCPPKLVIFDIRSNRTVVSYTFPDNVANKQDSFLYDLVVDNSEGDYAYITDNSGKDPGIIVYSLRDNRSWKARHASMKADPSATEFRIGGVSVTAPINIAGIALGPKIHNPNAQVVIVDDREVYYSPLSSRHLYAVNSSALKSEVVSTNSFEFSRQVADLGLKASQTAGMVMDNKGVLYYGLLSDSSIAQWDSNTPFQTGQRVVSRDNEYLQWPSSFAFDDTGNLAVVTNKLQKFIYDRIILDQSNFRILSANVQSASYLHYNPYDYSQVQTSSAINNWESSTRGDMIPHFDHTPSEMPTSTSTTPRPYQPTQNNQVKTSSATQAEVSFLGVFLAAMFFAFN